VRADFTRLVLRPIGQCVELLQRVLRYVLDHITAVIALGRAPRYDASAGTSVTMELLSPVPARPTVAGAGPRAADLPGAAEAPETYRQPTYTV
jgi:hypothetical protein